MDENKIDWMFRILCKLVRNSDQFTEEEKIELLVEVSKREDGERS